MIKQRRKGYGIRFDNDLSGNHIDRVRANGYQFGVFLNFAERQCPQCKRKKPTKGGLGKGKYWHCGDCVSRKLTL